MLDLSSYEEYRSANPVGDLEHFLFARTGEWAAVTSDGDYALLGGIGAFTADIMRALQYDREKVLLQFVADWHTQGNNGASVEWVPKLLDHVLGAGKGSHVWPVAR